LIFFGLVCFFTLHSLWQEYSKRKNCPKTAKCIPNGATNWPLFGTSLVLLRNSHRILDWMLDRIIQVNKEKEFPNPFSTEIHCKAKHFIYGTLFFAATPRT